MDSLSEEEYARLVEPLRQATPEAATGPGIAALFTTSSYRRWLWLGLGGAVVLVIQVVGFGDSIMSGVLRKGRTWRRFRMWARSKSWN